MPTHFNPRTRVECDVYDIIRFRDTEDFNPRTRVECDTDHDVYGYRTIDFNPRTRVECDLNLMDTVFRDREFQSTHSCRVRLMKYLPIFK